MNSYPCLRIGCYYQKRLNLEHSLYTILQILNITVFENILITQVFTDFGVTNQSVDFPNPLLLLEL